MVVRSSEESPVSRRFKWLLLFADIKTKVDLSCLNQNYLARGLREPGASLEHLLYFLLEGPGGHWTLSRRKGISDARMSKQGSEKEEREQSILSGENGARTEHQGLVKVSQSGRVSHHLLSMATC